MSILKRSSSAFIIASTSNDQFSDACSKHFVNSVSASWNLFFTLRNSADTFKKGKCDRHKARQQDNSSPYRRSTIPSSLQPIMPCVICSLLQNYFAPHPPPPGNRWFPVSVFVFTLQIMLTLRGWGILTQFYREHAGAGQKFSIPRASEPPG